MNTLSFTTVSKNMCGDEPIQGSKRPLQSNFHTFEERLRKTWENGKMPRSGIGRI